MNIPFDSLYADLGAHELELWQQQLPALIDQVFSARNHGKREEWENILANLPAAVPSNVELTADCIQIGTQQDMPAAAHESLYGLLKQLHPWRKGPYELFGIHIDTEWHSDWKWQRLKPHLSPLQNRRVLDVGCGNGYHLWRMLGEGAQLAVGADPSQFFLVQFHALKHYVTAALGEQPIHLIPLKSEELPAINARQQSNGFDTVFSMGVLYHRPSPITHLQELKRFLRPGGELVLETLIIKGQDQHVLLPQDRYAQMRNVWFLPTTALLTRMLERVGFGDIQIVDINQTSTQEQRQTEWMTFDSLANFLDPNDPNKTIEGYDAPLRAVVICKH